MAFKKIQTLEAETTTALGGINSKTGKPNPTSIEGYLLGTKTITNADGQASKVHYFKTSKGNQAIWGKTNIDAQLAGVSLGTMTRVTFEGKVKVKKGFMYKFLVETDEENTIEVNTPKSATVQATSAYEEEEEDAPSLDDEDSEIDSYESDESSQAIALAAAEKKAKVAALLAKKK